MQPWLLVPVLTVVGLVAPVVTLILEEDNFFQMIWQAPTGLCQKFEDAKHPMDFNLDDYGIISNPRNRYDGEYTAIFYHYGRFPMYAFSNPNAEDNGGIPQKGNLGLHLKDARDDINREIPNRAFGGVGVLNQEEWRPLFRQNFGVKSIYQDRSIEYYMKKHKGERNMSKVFVQSEKEFDRVSLQYSVESLKLGHRMRPNGKWGYYAFPYCYNSKVPVADACSAGTQAVNTRLKPMWDAATAVLPSIYLWQKYDPENRDNFIYSQIEEGVRVARLSDTYTPVYVYTKMIYDVKTYYRETDIYATLRMPADFGVEGVIIWGADIEFNNQKDCTAMRKLISEIVGPYSRKINIWAEKCSRERCSGNGRCVHRGAIDRQYRREMFRKWWADFDDWTVYETDGSTKYRCKCLPKYTGDECSTHA